MLLLSLIVAKGIISNVFAGNTLVAYWSFDEGTGNFPRDQSGNGNDAIIHGASWTTGKIRQALKFSGIDEYVSIPELFSSSPASLTISLWMNSKMNGTTEGVMFYHHGNSGEIELTTGHQYDSGDLNPTVVFFGVKLSDDVWYKVYSDTIAPNVWHNIVGVWVKGDSARLYVDGALANSKTVPDNYLLASSDTRFHPSLGVWHNSVVGPMYWYEGAIDEAIVYDYARTPEQIAQYYAYPVPPSSETTNTSPSPAPNTSPSPTPNSTSPPSSPTPNQTSTPEPHVTSSSQTPFDQPTLLVTISVASLAIAVPVIVVTKKRRDKSRRKVPPDGAIESKDRKGINSPTKKSKKVPYDVFISYSTRDKNVADALCATLESRKIRCWIAPRDVRAGTEYPAAIIQAINNSRILVLVFSKEANGSSQVMREVERAVSKGIPIIPLRIENVEPTESMEYLLCTPHWLDAMTPPLERHLQELAETVQLLLEDRNEKPDSNPNSI
jgi:hypothetical protein